MHQKCSNIWFNITFFGQLRSRSYHHKSVRYMSKFILNYVWITGNCRKYMKITKLSDLFLKNSQFGNQISLNRMTYSIIRNFPNIPPISVEVLLKCSFPWDLFRWCKILSRMLTRDQTSIVLIKKIDVMPLVRMRDKSLQIKSRNTFSVIRTRDVKTTRVWRLIAAIHMSWKADSRRIILTIYNRVIIDHERRE